MSGERVVVAMSGGVDSAVAAARCVADGYDVIGISLRLARDGSGSCCSLDDFHDARAVADRLGFPHYVFDFSEVFEREVVAPFVADYLAGRTPNPCARCNQHVKFDPLWQRARELGARWLATGHYARLGRDTLHGHPVLRTARDAGKDQTYFLFGLDASVLERTLFPVGSLTKSEVRHEAAALGLAVADKPESMEVCFVPAAGAAAFVERRAPLEALRPGTLVDETGRVLGRHDGVHRFTVGQRRGLGLGGGGRRYVKALDAARGTVTVVEGPERLAASGLHAERVTWSGDRVPSPGTRVAARVRHRHVPATAWIERASRDTATIVFDGAGPAVTPGQAVVFYQDDVVVGGGWIAHEVTMPCAAAVGS
jgi:tRNA-specific 2-thiouridylase